ncbi:MAG: 16S rRNA pseudouridine(516) synthase RsuA [Chromatiales bacterium]|nr:16S rRNA pseudouridine(516) synthase RsuA [Chromatiales bacterium]
MRLDKLLCHATGLSRSQAQKIIRRLEVEVDGVAVRDPAMAVDAATAVVWQGREIKLSGPRYFMLNKPQGVVSATVDAQYTTVIDLLDEGNLRGLHVAGRLDIDTTGLVLISDDGEWSHRITSPRHRCEKSYLVTLTDPLDDSLVEQFAAGIELKGEKGRCKAARLEPLTANTARLIISEGKYHQVKRMFAAVGNHVVALHRERIGGLPLDETLAEGEYRALHEEEVRLF